MLPDGWTKVPLSQVAEIRMGIAVGKNDFEDPVELPYLRVANVQDGCLIYLRSRQFAWSALKLSDTSCELVMCS